ncbi:MAG: NAD-dependent epimerase/dehydratase family protein [Bacteroidales bacterium]
MKILVTGANGFLAGNIILELLGRGYKVRGMIRKSARIIIEHKDLEAFYGNITDPGDVMKAAESCHIIIHSAAATNQALPDYSAFANVNVGGTDNILKACLKHNVKKLIFVSTANTLGYGSKKFPGNENLPMKYPFTKSHYARSKAAAQVLLIRGLANSGTALTIVNPTFMLGPNDQKISSNIIILRAYNKRLVFIPPGGKNFIHVKDAATGVCYSIEHGTNGECYILANENLTYREFYSLMMKVTGQNSYLVTIPRYFLLLIGLAGNILRFAGVRTSLSLTNMKILCTGNYYSPHKAVSVLKLTQTPTVKAIDDALSWFRSEDKLNQKN